MVTVLWLAALPSGAEGTLDSRKAAVLAAREASVLGLLGGFGFPVPDRIETAVGSLNLADGHDRSALAQSLDGADRDGAAALSSLVATGVQPSPDVRRVLGPLSVTDRAGALAGRTIAVEPEEYLRAIDHLLNHGGVAPTSPAPPDPSALATKLRSVIDSLTTSPPKGVTPSTNRPATPGPDVVPSAPSGTSPIVPIAIVGVIGIVGAGLFLLGRRGTSKPVPSNPTTAASSMAVAGSMQKLLDVSRRLTEAAASGDVDHTIVRYALELVPGAGGAVIRRLGDDLVATAQLPDDLLVATRVPDGAIRRVAETGQGLVQVSASEPALRNLPAALAAVPLVGGGRVEAVLMLVRDEAEPFVAAERDVLLALAPVAAAALQSAGQARAAIEDSLVDPLTGVGNRRRFDMELAGAIGPGSPTALLMVDLDHFKSVNDRHGHLAGDALLKGVSGVMRDWVRPGDSVYRLGGEEFSVLLRGASAEEAKAVAERVRAALAQRKFRVGAREPLGATASIGVAAANDGDARDLVARADAALYDAKQSGRNRVEVR